MNARRQRLFPGALLFWTAVLAALVLFMPDLKPVFRALFPGLERPLYETESFLVLILVHIGLVASAGALSILIGVTAGIFVTRPAGRDFRPTIETLVAMGQTVPPAAVLAIAGPLMGFGARPAVLALTLYGILPIVRATTAGLESVPAPLLEAARGLGMTPLGILLKAELPMAAPVIVAGIRVSVVTAIGTAAIASTVGAKTLGTPLIIGLDGFNTAYVLQGTMVIGLLAIVTDLALERLRLRLERWKR